jgi:uncharacterized protein (DUF427 family)
MSTTREPLIPGPDHPITIKPFAGRVTVTAGDVKVADTAAALELRESTYPPVYYVPLADVDSTVLKPTDTSTYCPYKGDASYYSVVASAEGQAVEDAVWHYEHPYPSVAEIADHVAFYTDRVEVSAQPEPGA